MPQDSSQAGPTNDNKREMRMVVMYTERIKAEQMRQNDITYRSTLLHKSLIVRKYCFQALSDTTEDYRVLAAHEQVLCRMPSRHSTRPQVSEYNKFLKIRNAYFAADFVLGFAISPTADSCSGCGEPMLSAQILNLMRDRFGVEYTVHEGQSNSAFEHTFCCVEPNSADLLVARYRARTAALIGLNNLNCLSLRSIGDIHHPVMAIAIAGNLAHVEMFNGNRKSGLVRKRKAERRKFTDLLQKTIMKSDEDLELDTYEGLWSLFGYIAVGNTFARGNFRENVICQVRQLLRLSRSGSA